MRRACIAILLVAVACGNGSKPLSEPSAAASIGVSSSAFERGGPIPARFTCDGGGVSPPMSWEPVRDVVVSYALVVTDPDAPGGPFVHWVLFGIDAHGLTEGAVPPDASEGTNSFGDVGYGPPCPPHGDSAHRYVFTVYAARRGTAIPETGATADDLLAAIDGRVIAKGRLIGVYRR